MEKSCRNCKCWDQDLIREEPFSRPGIDSGEICSVVGIGYVSICRANSNFNKTLASDSCALFTEKGPNPNENCEINCRELQKIDGD